MRGISIVGRMEEWTRMLRQPVATQMRETAFALLDQGTPCQEVSVGSRTSTKLLAPEPDLTELRPESMYSTTARRFAEVGNPTTAP